TYSTSRTAPARTPLFRRPVPRASGPSTAPGLTTKGASFKAASSTTSSLLFWGDCETSVDAHATDRPGRLRRRTGTACAGGTGAGRGRLGRSGVPRHRRTPDLRFLLEGHRLHHGPHA